MTEFPPLVRHAHALAEQLGFPLMPEGRPYGYNGPPSACIPAVGRLLMTLVASKPGGRFAEHGTGAGVGAAWMSSGMTADSSLITVEIDAARAVAVRELFREIPNVEIRTGDWHQLLAAEPLFDLVFMDAGVRPELESREWDSLVESVNVGGFILMDDMIPLGVLPEQARELVDYKREFAFANPRVIATEVLTTATTSALVIARVS